MIDIKDEVMMIQASLDAIINAEHVTLAERVRILETLADSFSVAAQLVAESEDDGDSDE